MSFLGVAAGVKAAAASYSPAAKFGVKVSEVEYRLTTAGRQLMARIYEPAGTEPFPTVLDLHGGAWNA
jgi:acetyl esterase